MYVCIYMYMCYVNVNLERNGIICMYACVYVYVCMYIHTSMPTFEHLPPYRETLAWTVEHVAAHSDLQQADLPAAVSVSVDQRKDEHAVHHLVAVRGHLVRHSLGILHHHIH